MNELTVKEKRELKRLLKKAHLSTQPAPTYIIRYMNSSGDTVYSDTLQLDGILRFGVYDAMIYALENAEIDVDSMIKYEGTSDEIVEISFRKEF